MTLDLFSQPLHLRHFSGSDYIPALDQKRLTGQLERIYNLMKDGKYRTLSEIKEATGDPEASISAQIRHLNNKHDIPHEKRPRGDRKNGLWEYRLLK